MLQRVLFLLALPLALVACDTTGESDAGPRQDVGPTADAGRADAGPSDAGRADAGPGDAGPSDAGPSDAGPSDAGRADAGPSDAGGPYTGHEAILNGIVGYGREVTGGAGGRLIEVTTLANAGPGSLREAIAVEGPTWIYFTPGLEGTIRLSSLLYMRSDTTLDGRGANIAIGGHSLNVYEDDGTAVPANNIVLHNLRFTGGLPDERNLVRLRYGTGFWLDHISFEAQSGDGKPLTTADGATDVTVSWCDFSNNEVSLIWLVSSNNETPGDANIRITAHHNLFDGTNERHPRARYATIHWLNNYVGDWGQYGSSITQDGHFLADHSIYAAGRRSDNAIITRIGSWPSSGDPIQGNLRLVDNLFDGADTPDERNPEAVAAPPYPYEAENADAALEARIRAGVGWRNVPSPFE